MSFWQVSDQTALADATVPLDQVVDPNVVIQHQQQQDQPEEQQHHHQPQQHEVNATSPELTLTTTSCKTSQPCSVFLKFNVIVGQ